MGITAGQRGQRAAPRRSPLAAVALPEPIVNNPSITWPGQDGGFTGGIWHPHLLRCDPSSERIEIDALVTRGP